MIIVALIDILIVLVIFLMVTTTFKQQPALKLALPESSQAQKTGASEAPPPIAMPASVPVTLERLRQELLGAVAKTPELRLALSADKMAPFGQVVKVMDVAKEANLKVVNAYTKETGKP